MKIPTAEEMVRAQFMRALLQVLQHESLHQRHGNGVDMDGMIALLRIAFADDPIAAERAWDEEQRRFVSPGDPRAYKTDVALQYAKEQGMEVEQLTPPAEDTYHQRTVEAKQHVHMDTTTMQHFCGVGRLYGGSTPRWDDVTCPHCLRDRGEADGARLAANKAIDIALSAKLRKQGWEAPPALAAGQRWWNSGAPVATNLVVLSHEKAALDTCVALVQRGTAFRCTRVQIGGLDAWEFEVPVDATL
jgi:hypothetical protein